MEQEATNLSGQKAVVLGANDPTAAAVALALAQAGADVAVTSSSGDPEEAFALRPLRRKIEAEGRQAIADIADLANGSSVQIAIRQIAKQLGRIDLVVVCAGEALDKAPARVSDAEWSRAIAFNLGAYFYVARATLRELEDNEAIDGVRGRIVALLPPTDAASASPIVNAARAGVEALVLGLAREWAPQGVLVTSVSSGDNEDAAVHEVLRLAVATSAD